MLIRKSALTVLAYYGITVLWAPATPWERDRMAFAPKA